MSFSRFHDEAHVHYPAGEDPPSRSELAEDEREIQERRRARARRAGVVSLADFAPTPPEDIAA